MLKRKNVFSADQKLERLREAAITEFGFAADTVSATWNPNQPTNHENTDFIVLRIMPTPNGMADSDYARVQPFAAAELQKFWMGKRPLIDLKMDLPKHEAKHRDPNAPPAPLSS